MALQGELDRGVYQRAYGLLNLWDLHSDMRLSMVATIHGRMHGSTAVAFEPDGGV